MASGNRCREAYTAGGEATLLSLEILNVDAFVLVRLLQNSSGHSEEIKI